MLIIAGKEVEFSNKVNAIYCWDFNWLDLLFKYWTPVTLEAKQGKILSVNSFSLDISPLDKAHTFIFIPFSGGKKAVKNFFSFLNSNLNCVDTFRQCVADASLSVNPTSKGKDSTRATFLANGPTTSILCSRKRPSQSQQGGLHSALSSQAKKLHQARLFQFDMLYLFFPKGEVLNIVTARWRRTGFVGVGSYFEKLSIWYENMLGGHWTAG